MLNAVRFIQLFNHNSLQVVYPCEDVKIGKYKLQVRESRARYT